MKTSNDSLKNKAITGAFWQLMQKGSIQVVSFVVSLVLARLVDPSEFGVIAMTSIFMSVAGVIADSGLGTSLVQKKDIDDLDKDTVFYFSVALSVFIYLILFFSAPLIARMYKVPVLVSVIRIGSLSLLASGFNSIQSAVVMRSMDFRKFFYATFVSTILSAIVGITMAYQGYGIWALITQNLCRSIGSVLVLFSLVHWLPGLSFSWTRLKHLYSFGLNLMAASLVGTFFNELRGFLIGLRFKPADLAFFNRGNSIPGIINDNVTGTFSTVLFPALTKFQDDKMALKNAMRRSMMTSSFILAPLMLLLAVTSKQIILLLYTEKWIQAVPFMQLAVFHYLFSIMGGANLQALNAIGRSDITFKLEFVKKPIFFAILLYTCRISPIALSVGCAVYSFIGASINALPNKKLLGYNYLHQLFDIMPQILVAMVASIIVYMIGMLNWNVLLVLAIQWVVGVGLYISFAALFRMESYRYLVETIQGYLKSRCEEKCFMDDVFSKR